MGTSPSGMSLLYPKNEDWVDLIVSLDMLVARRKISIPTGN
jgi:hypothetical protein